MHVTMNIKISSDFKFTVSSIQYMPNGELHISLSSGEDTNVNYEYKASLGNGEAMEKPSISLLQYARDYTKRSNIQPKTKSTYHLMCNHLQQYGDCASTISTIII